VLIGTHIELVLLLNIKGTALLNKDPRLLRVVGDLTFNLVVLLSNNSEIDDFKRNRFSKIIEFLQLNKIGIYK
jgi:hypothetical protein